MTPTEQFKIDIKAYLDNRAANDELFAPMYAKEGKNIDDCCTYIMNTVKAFAEKNKSKAVGLSDSEIYGMAVHYYTEDNVKVGTPMKVDVVVNHVIELTEEEKAAAKQKAIDDLVAKQRETLSKKHTPKKQETAEAPTLF